MGSFLTPLVLNGCKNFRYVYGIWDTQIYPDQLMLITVLVLR